MGRNSCDKDETTAFAANVHVHHMREVFSIFGIDIDKWAVCQIADNCPRNKKIASITINHLRMHDSRYFHNVMQPRNSLHCSNSQRRALKFWKLL